MLLLSLPGSLYLALFSPETGDLAGDVWVVRVRGEVEGLYIHVPPPQSAAGLARGWHAWCIC